MPNFEYDTRTSEEKKNLMKGKLPFDATKTTKEDDLQAAETVENDGRRHLHRHTA